MKAFTAVSFLCCATVLAVSSSAWAKNQAGVASFVQGDVYRGESDDGPFKRVHQGSALYEGDVIKTDKDARFEGKLNDRSVIRLGAESQVKLDKADMPKSEDQPKTFLAKLLVGRLWAKVTSLVGESRFEVTTANAVAGVRGTVFAVDHGSDNSTSVKVFSGRVLVSNKPVYLQEGRKGARVQVSGPQEVSKKQWEEAVASALQEITVGASGELAQPKGFAQADAAKDEWVAWNQKRDGN